MKRQIQGKRKSRPRNRGSSIRGRFRPPNTTAEFFAMPKPIQQTYTNVLGVILLMRKGNSLTRAMRGAGVTRAQVDRFAGSALLKQRNGRYKAKAYDRLLRVVMVVSDDGPLEVPTRDSRQASKAGRHSSAVHKYLQTGDDSTLAQFRGKYVIDAEGKRIPLLTDLEELDRSGSAGVLTFESLYARSL